MICFNGSDLISLKANNGLLQPRLQDDDDGDDDEHLLFTMNGRQKNRTNRTVYNLTTT